MGHQTQTSVCSLEWYWLRERFCHVNWFYPHEDFTLNFNKMRVITRRYLRSLSSFLVFWNIISMSIDFSCAFILYKTCLKSSFDLNKIMTFLFADINLLFLLDLIIIGTRSFRLQHTKIFIACLSTNVHVILPIGLCTISIGID